MEYFLKSARLGFRCWTAEDLSLARGLWGDSEVAAYLGGPFTSEMVRARLAKEMAKCDADIARVEQKLGNADFLKRAPEEVVEGEREKRDEALARKAKIAEALQRLQGAA